MSPPPSRTTTARKRRKPANMVFTEAIDILTERLFELSQEYQQIDRQLRTLRRGLTVEQILADPKISSLADQQRQINNEAMDLQHRHRVTSR